MHNPPCIIVAAISSRPYVQMAVKAGFKVIAIDAFLDQDLMEVADATYLVPVNAGAFQADALLAIVDQLDCAHIQGLCYGSGFESQPELLCALEQRISLIGNSYASVTACKAPLTFFDFCQRHDFKYPEVAFQTPLDPQGWLVKHHGSSGGGHIQYLNRQRLSSDAGVSVNQYYQQFQAGKPVSCLFLSNGRHVEIVGYNEQWCDAVDHAPFRYGGAVSHADFPEDLQSKMQHFVTVASETFNLVGLNSCDAIVHDGQLYFLEINPRLSATAALYTSSVGDLFLAHVTASERRDLSSLVLDSAPKAHQVKYATHDCSIANIEHWPEWISDRPSAKQTITSDMPILTVTSQASDVSSARQLLKQRADSLF